MQAAICTKYGSPDVIRIAEVKKPTPKDDEVLIKIHAASLNAADLENLLGIPFIRLTAPLRPRHKILGSDVAGVIEAVGKNVKDFKIGDKICADLFEYGFGAFAEYVCAPQKALILKPDSMTFEEVATLPQAAILALQGMRDNKTITPGQTVLINGAGGGIGTFAIQIAKYYGAEVTGVDTAEKFDVMSKLGADHVIDFTKEDFTKNRELYDLILDVSAHHSISDYANSLSNDGAYLMVGGKTSAVFKTAFLTQKQTAETKKSMGLLFWKQYNKADFNLLFKLIKDKDIFPVIDRQYKLCETADAFQYLKDGHAKGKIIIKIS